MRSTIILAALAATPTMTMAQETPTAKPPAKAAEQTVGEVVVTGQEPAVRTSIDRRSYGIASDLQAQSGSIADALRNIPSVEVDVQGNLSLRGDPNVTILIDGKPSGMFEGDNKAQSLQSLPANQIERVEVITNPSAEFRADGTGGVINLISKKARGVGRTGSAKLTVANAGRVFAGANVGYNSAKLSVTGDLDVRHDNEKQWVTEDRDNLQTATGDLLGSRLDQVQHSTLDIDTVRGAFDYDLDAYNRLSGELRGAYVDFTLGGPSAYRTLSQDGALVGAFQRDLDLHQMRSNGAASATWKHSFAERGHELTLNLSYDVTDDDRVRAGHTLGVLPAGGETYDRQLLDYDYRRTELKGDYVRPFADGSTLKAGFDLQFDDNSYRNRGFRGASRADLAADPNLSNLFLFEQALTQGYVTYERRFGELSVLAGLRIEDVRIDLDQRTQGRKDENDYQKAYPSLHLGWKLDEGQQLTASYSHRVQRPNPLQFNSFRMLFDPLTLRSGNPDLKPQETHSWEIGYENRGSPATYTATFYYRENKNGFSDVFQDLGGGVLLLTSGNFSRSRALGLELVTNGRFTPTLSYNASANLARTTIDPQPFGTPYSRSATSIGGRANLTWQATPKDLLQLNAVLNARRLTTQGEVAPTGGLNLGYRHKLNERLSVLVTAEDVLHSFRFRQTVETPQLQSAARYRFDSRQIQVGLAWTFGGGRQREPGFEFSTGGGAPAQ